MNRTRALAPAAVALTAILFSAGAAAPAMAKGGDVRTSGGCAGPAVWKLKASPEDGRIEVEGEIDSNRSGQTWRWTLKHNGSVVGTGTRTTAGPSGSFEVRRVTGNAAGTDMFVFNAHRPGTSQACHGVVRF
jgi:hypothetical protein